MACTVAGTSICSTGWVRGEAPRGPTPAPAAAPPRGQRPRPQLRQPALAAPLVPVLGPVVDEQQDSRPGQALDQAVEEDPGLAVDPVEILEDEQDGLDLALAEQQPPDGVLGAPPALGGFERLP